MVTMDAALLELNERAADVKDRVKASVKDVERLKVECVAKEEELKRTQRLEEDSRWPALNDWCVHFAFFCADHLTLGLRHKVFRCRVIA